MTTPKTSTDHAEEVALFRHGVIAPLLNRDFGHGELSQALRDAAAIRYRLPNSTRTRYFGVSTIERWYYAYLADGFEALLPSARSDRGRARAISEAKRALLLDIRREHPTASAPLILRTLVNEGQLAKGEISVATLNRLYAEHNLRRQRRGAKGKPKPRRERRRWQVERPGVLWHGDVCHGPTLIDVETQRRTPVRIHALMDDASRYVVALEVHTQEREREMLGLFARAVQRHGLPQRLYLDNGSTYRGEDLKGIGARLNMKVTHAGPYDPEARGKMERFWSTMRQQCLDFIDTSASLHDVTVRLNAWLDEHYHRAPHAGLMGKSPTRRWEDNDRDVRKPGFDQLLEAFTTRDNRRVRKDGTLDIDGRTYEVAQGYLAGKNVQILRGLPPFSVDYTPQVLVEGTPHPLSLVAPEANATRNRKPIPVPEPGQGAIDFNPAETALKQATGKLARTNHTTEDRP